MREIREKSGFQFSRGAGQRPLGTAHSARKPLKTTERQYAQV